MRIAQIAPLYEAVPPRLYGGTERVVAHLTDALVRQGHEVTLFSSADAQTSASLVAASLRGCLCRRRNAWVCDVCVSIPTRRLLRDRSRT